MKNLVESKTGTKAQVPDLFPNDANLQARLDGLKSKGYTLHTVDVEWDGTIKIACKPPGVKKGHGWKNEYVEMGKLSDKAMEKFKPLIEWEKSKYSEEVKLEGGALVFSIENGVINTQTVTGRVTREGGGWSWLGSISTKSLFLPEQENLKLTGNSE